MIPAAVDGLCSVMFLRSTGRASGEEEEEDGPCEATTAVQAALRQRRRHVRQEARPQRQLVNAGHMAIVNVM